MIITAMLRVFGSESAFEVQQTKLARKGLHRAGPIVAVAKCIPLVCSTEGRRGR